MSNNQLYYIIYNFRPQTTPLSSAEYIVKERNSMTGRIMLSMNQSHGLGSGIYGLIRDPITGIIPGADTRSNEIVTPIALVNPLILDTNEKFSDFVDLSRYLMDLCEATIHRDNGERRVLLAKLFKYEVLRKKIAPKSHKIIPTVNKFTSTFIRKMVPGDYIRQPINFLLSDAYDGIYNSSKNGNCYSAGSVYFSDVEPVRRQPKGRSQGPREEGHDLYGGKTNKRKTNKRKTNKRKTNKRKTNKRKTNKRKN
uniref:Uncharacterized protein n=1 Tax=viral metagenome TaxID=1070528 RepID=A0A6C0KJ37_9ZZZZ